MGVDIISQCTDFSIGGESLSDFSDVYVKSVMRPAMAQQRYSYETIPGSDKTCSFRDGLSNKVVTIELLLLAETTSERRTTASDLAYWIQSGSEIEFEDESGKYYAYTLADVITDTEEALCNTLSVTLNCEALAYSATQTVTKSDVTAMCDIEVANSGTYETRPVFVFDGTATSVTLTLDNKSFTVTSIGEKTYVDCENMTCYTIAGGAKVNKLLDFSGSFFALSPGDNTIALSGTGLSFDLTVNFRYMYL